MGKPRPVRPEQGPCRAGAVRSAGGERILPDGRAENPAQAGQHPEGAPAVRRRPRGGGHHRVAGAGAVGRGGNGAGHEAGPQEEQGLRDGGRRRVRRGADMGGGHVRGPLQAGQPDGDHRSQRTPDRRHNGRSDGAGAAVGEVEGVRMARDGNRRPQHGRSGQGA